MGRTTENRIQLIAFTLPFTGQSLPFFEIRPCLSEAPVVFWLASSPGKGVTEPLLRGEEKNDKK